MNKVELEGILHTEPKATGEGNEKRALFCLKVDDSNGFNTIFPAKAWREVGNQILQMHKGDHIHCEGKVTRYKPKDLDTWVTDIEITKVI